MNRITGYTTKDLKYVSNGLCPDCDECKDTFGYDNMEKFNQDIESGEVCDEGSFSHNPCDECNTSLGGDSYIAHGIDSNYNIVHFRTCYNCLFEIEGYTICKNCNHVCDNYGAYCHNCDHEID